MRNMWVLGVLIISTMGWVQGQTLAEPMGTAFTYQGQLKEGGVPANGEYDFMFRLFGQPEGGDEIPGTQGGTLVDDVLVTDGLFTVGLDFGPDVFQNNYGLWMEIAVKPAEFAPADFTILTPRQRLSPAPRAIVADYAKSTVGGTLRFGEMSDTSIGVTPNLSGLTAMDPFGMRVTSTTVARQCSGSGEPCWFDQHCPVGETCEPCDSCGSVPNGAGGMYFGLADEVSIGKKAGSSGLAVKSEGGLFLLGGTHVCSEEYGTSSPVLHCETDTDCYGCCSTMERCSTNGELCDSADECPWPGSCKMDAACTTRCYSDAECPDEGSFCDSPVPGECVVPAGRCSGSHAPCYENEDCSAGYCTEFPETVCWTDYHCFWSDENLPYSFQDIGPCVGAEECVHPEPIGPVAVNFGDTGAFSIGFNPILGGLTGTDPEGLHLVSSADTCSGSGEPCVSDEDCPAGGCSGQEYPCHNDDICGFGSTCTEPAPETCESIYGMGSIKVLFGLGSDSSIGTDSASTGLVVKDPVGLRLMSPGVDRSAPTKLFLGPTDDYFIGFNPIYTGTHINDPDGVHLTSMIAGAAQTAGEEPIDVRLYFGPTSDTYIGTLPDATGLALSDPGGVRILNSIDPAENALIFGMDGARGFGGTRIDTGIASGGMRLLASGFFFDQGPVGIGDSSPDAHLDVEKDFPAGTPGAVAVFNRTGSDGVILDFQTDGTSAGTISVSRGIVSYNSFTGSHLARSNANLERGTLVRMTGSNTYLHDDPESEIVYGMEPSLEVNDPRCMGAYLGRHRVDDVDDSPDTHLVMAQGNGEMWVVDTGGNLQPGDYLISSDVPGCAMKDDPLRFPIGHIVARAAEGVAWSAVGADDHGVRKARISVFFESFVRANDTARLTNEVARLTHAVESQRSTIQTLQQKLESLQGAVEHLSRTEPATTFSAESADPSLGGTK